MKRLMGQILHFNIKSGNWQGSFDLVVVVGLPVVADLAIFLWLGPTCYFYTHSKVNTRLYQ